MYTFSFMQIFFHKDCLYLAIAEQSSTGNKIPMHYACSVVLISKSISLFIYSYQGSLLILSGYVWPQKLKGSLPSFFFSYEQVSFSTFVLEIKNMYVGLSFIFSVHSVSSLGFFTAEYFD